jgi:hypothetical protein
VSQSTAYRQQITNSVAYRNLPVPPDALFKLRPAPGNGWGAFATQPIACGTTIFMEQPIFVIPKPPKNLTEADVSMALHQVPPSRKTHLNTCMSSVRNNPSAPYTSITKLFEDNSRLVKTGHGFLPLHSRLNHSCVPNCMNVNVVAEAPANNDGAVACIATQNIAKGDELTVSYKVGLRCMTRTERQRNLRFVCTRKACAAGIPSQQLSDMLRTLARGCSYLFRGTDVTRQKLASETALVSDPKLKKAAEEMNIKLCNRLVYLLLIMTLFEQEGVMDSFMVQRLEPIILVMLGTFKENRNAKLAMFAVTQKTRWGRFCIAARLWGRSDAGCDAAFAETMRKVDERGRLITDV